MQFTPSPSYPVTHVQLKLPSVSEQIAFVLQLSASRSHSSMSMWCKYRNEHWTLVGNKTDIENYSATENFDNQHRGSFMYQCIVNVNSLWKIASSGLDSLVQITPSPSYPVTHVHLKLPSVSEQIAFVLQLSTSRSHSSISVWCKHRNEHWTLVRN